MSRSTPAFRLLLTSLTTIVALAGVLGCGPQGPASNASTASDSMGYPERVEGGQSGTGMLSENALLDFQVMGDGSRVVREDFKVKDMPFAEAVRLTGITRGDDPWTMQLGMRNKAPIASGDVILASFWVRCARSLQESGEGQTEFVLELGQDPWTKSVSQPVRVGQEWQEIHIPFTSVAAYEPGQAQFLFRLGYEPQTIELGGLRMHNFKNKLSTDALPKTKVSYSGREADAAWRQLAAARIDQYRKGDFKISVTDAAGKPIAGAKVQVKQLRHSFWFGTAIQGDAIVHAAQNKEYVEHIPELFNSIVLENDLKWEPLEGDWGNNWSLENAQKALDWANASGLNTRGHVLVWPSFKHLPKRLAALQTDKPALKAAVEEHVRDLTQKMAGKLDHWDVVNEPYDNHELMDLLGEDVMIDWFKIAHEADPSAKLYLNDYSILSGGGGETGHRAHFEKTARALIEKGAPLHGLGMQGHFGSALSSPDDLKKLLDRYAALGKPIMVTEYDITADDPDLAADYTRDFYTVLFSHPAVEGIMMWGFYDGKHWKNAAPLFDTSWKLKKSGAAYKKLVLGDWMTTAEIVTDAQGEASVRGFLGDYTIGVTSGEKGAQMPAQLLKGGSRATVVIK